MPGRTSLAERILRVVSSAEALFQNVFGSDCVSGSGMDGQQNLAGIACCAHPGILLERCLIRPPSRERISRRFSPVLSRMKTRSVKSNAKVRLARLLSNRLITSFGGTEWPPLSTRSSMRAWHIPGLETQMKIRLTLYPAAPARFIRSIFLLPEKVVSMAKLTFWDRNRSCFRMAIFPDWMGLGRCVPEMLSGDITGMRGAIQRSAIVVFPAPFGPATIHSWGIKDPE